jgi:phosphoesterase RecJ-like protein
MGSFNKLKKLLEDKERFLLICHIEPDGDAVGSMLGLAEALNSKGKITSMLCRDEAPAILGYLNNFLSIKQSLPEDGFEAIILLDNGDFKRTGFIPEINSARGEKIPVLNIDHHPKNDLWKIADVNYSNENVSSTSELVYDILIGLDYEITPSIATALLTGIFYDTGGFRHPNTTEAVLDISADLLRRGAKLQKISENISNHKPVSLFRLWGVALNRLKLNKNLSVSVSAITQKDLQDCDASEDDISGLVNLLNSAPESKAALLLYETKDAKIRGSLRTERDDVDVSKLAQLLGGGGHKKASGFTVDGKIKVDGDNWEII